MPDAANLRGPAIVDSGRHIAVDQQNAYTRRDAARGIELGNRRPPRCALSAAGLGVRSDPPCYGSGAAEVSGRCVQRGRGIGRRRRCATRQHLHSSERLRESRRTFDDVYMFPALLRACHSVIGGPFKLRSFLSRSLRPGAAAQELHADVRCDSADWPLVGFILMIDEFRPDNGATRFVPGSHRWAWLPEHDLADVHADHPQQVLACGPAGSLLVFNGSTWHGHTANRSDEPRRSLQGAFIPRDGRAATEFGARMQRDTFERLTPLARQILAL